MALRDKLISRSQPLLPPNTQVRQVFIFQTGPNPYWFLVTTILVFLIKHRIVCVTDDAIYVMNSSKMRMQPKELLATLPRNQQLGPASGLWSKMQLGPEQGWVHKRFHKDIAEADAAILQGR